ncbi:hypothetical protein Tco_0152319 [Tanacetum coccineum]
MKVEANASFIGRQRFDFNESILDSRGAVPSKTAADAKVAIQEMAEYSQKGHNGTSRTRSTETSDGLAAIQAQLNNLGREIKKVNKKVYAAQVGCEQCKGSYGPQFLEAYSEASHINNSIPIKEKDPRVSLCLALLIMFSLIMPLLGLGASVSVMPLSAYLNLGLGELAHTRLTVELADKTMKYPKGISKNVLVELRRDQVDDLMPAIEEGEVIEEFRARNDDRMVSKVFGYPSDCDYDKKIHMDCAYNLKFSCMIGQIGIQGK